MELFRLSTMNASQEQASILYDEIIKELNAPQANQLAQKISLTIQSAELCCVGITPRFKLRRDAASVYRTVSIGIAEYVLKEIEQRLFRQLIKLEHQEYDQHDATSIEKYCTEVINNSSLEEDRDGRQSRKKKIAAAFEQYLTDHNVLNIDGFVQFRLTSYKNELREVVEYAVEEFIMDKQYQEFILLLQYFVFVQDRKVPEVHIIHKEGSDFMILDEQFKPIEKKKTEDFVVEMIDKDLNYEDMIISALISISPEKICIHTRAKEMQVIKTIQQIFENRTVLCEDCSVCHPVLDKFSLDR